VAAAVVSAAANGLFSLWRHAAEKTEREHADRVSRLPRSSRRFLGARDAIPGQKAVAVLVGRTTIAGDERARL
jgi:hypothetical protein